MKAALHALSRDRKTIYTVTVTYVDGNLSARCDCKAGAYGGYCRHLAKFLAGDASLLADSKEEPVLATVAQWAQDSGLKVMNVQ